MTRNLSEFQKRLCLKCENRSKEVTDRVFCIYPGECPKIKEIAEKNKRERNNDWICYVIWWCNMLAKICKKCGALIPYPNTYCDKCRKQLPSKKENDKHYDKYRRNKTNDSFYHSKEWRALSAYILAKHNYQCAECGKVATEVHHIIEINEDWGKRLDIDNLMPLCTCCHNRKR